jgi:hypothetical protein
MILITMAIIISNLKQQVETLKIRPNNVPNFDDLCYRKG